MKYLFEIILVLIILYFVWNIVKRLLLAGLIKFTTRKFNNAANSDPVRPKKTKGNLTSKINWDAETVDYEEIKENKETKN